MSTQYGCSATAPAGGPAHHVCDLACDHPGPHLSYESGFQWGDPEPSPEPSHMVGIAQDISPLNDLACRINSNAREHGFWDTDRNMGEMLMLAVSELSEALEEHRLGKPAVYYPHHRPGCAVSDHRVYGMPGDEPDCTCTPKPEGVAVELADCIIRCLDTLHSLGVDIDKVVRDKMHYNATRPHKHGKRF